MCYKYGYRWKVNFDLGEYGNSVNDAKAVKL